MKIVTCVTSHNTLAFQRELVVLLLFSIPYGVKVILLYLRVSQSLLSCRNFFRTIQRIRFDSYFVFLTSRKMI